MITSLSRSVMTQKAHKAQIQKTQECKAQERKKQTSYSSIEPEVIVWEDGSVVLRRVFSLPEEKEERERRIQKSKSRRKKRYYGTFLFTAVSLFLICRWCGGQLLGDFEESTVFPESAPAIVNYSQPLSTTE